MTCEKCNGDMYYLVPNYRLEVMERVECMDCISHEHYKHHLSEELTKVLTKASPQKLALIVAELIVHNIDKNTHDDLSRVETIIQTKNLVEALVLGDVYNKQ
tara:strand:- start:59 stop:364 length:306 start_codon:yes stop_codon:yes gene_type:complete